MNDVILKDAWQVGSKVPVTNEAGEVIGTGTVLSGGEVSVELFDTTHTVIKGSLG